MTKKDVINNNEIGIKFMLVNRNFPEQLMVCAVVSKKRDWGMRNDKWRRRCCQTILAIKLAVVIGDCLRMRLCMCV